MARTVDTGDVAAQVSRRLFAFLRADRDGDCRLDATELLDRAGPAGAAKLQPADVDRDGYLTLAEYLQFKGHTEHAQAARGLFRSESARQYLVTATSPELRAVRADFLLSVGYYLGTQGQSADYERLIVEAGRIVHEGERHGTGEEIGALSDASGRPEAVVARIRTSSAALAQRADLARIGQTGGYSTPELVELVNAMREWEGDPSAAAALLMEVLERRQRRNARLGESFRTKLEPRAIRDFARAVETLRIPGMEREELFVALLRGNAQDSSAELPALLIELRRLGYDDGRIAGILTHAAERTASMARDPLANVRDAIQTMRRIDPAIDRDRLERMLFVGAGPVSHGLNAAPFLRLAPDLAQRRRILQAIGPDAIPAFCQLLGVTEFTRGGPLTAAEFDRLVSDCADAHQRYGITDYRQFSPATLRRLREQPAGDKVAIVALSAEDWNGAMDVDQDVQRLLAAGFHVIPVQATTETDIYARIRALPPGSVHALVVSAHASPSGLELSAGRGEPGRLDTSDGAEWRALARYFAPEATVLLMGCSTGKGAKTITDAMAQWLRQVRGLSVYGSPCNGGSDLEIVNGRAVISKVYCADGSDGVPVVR